MTQGARMRTVLALHALLLLYSASDVMSKLAAGYEPASLAFLACYGGLLAILAAYALGWQQVIKRLPLTYAYANRGITVVWGLVWGALLFSEAVTLPKVVGAAMIMGGIVLFSVADAREGGDGADG